LEGVLLEVIERSGLIRGDSDRLELKHHLLQEYFSGRGISDLSFIKSVVNDEWWRNSIVFYFGSRPQQVDDLLDVATSADTSTETAHITVGLALQTCYLSKLDVKLDVWKWVVEAAGMSMARTLEDENAKYPLADFVMAYLATREAVALSGIERDEFGLQQWAKAKELDPHPDAKHFWHLVALVELGELEKVRDELKARPLGDDRLTTALYFGLWFYAKVRARDGGKKDLAHELCESLELRVRTIRKKVIEQFKGQILELRKGSVVALDQEPPDQPKGVGRLAGH
jgi:hypothetical protein